MSKKPEKRIVKDIEREEEKGTIDVTLGGEVPKKDGKHEDKEKLRFVIRKRPIVRFPHFRFEEPVPKIGPDFEPFQNTLMEASGKFIFKKRLMGNPPLGFLDFEKRKLIEGKENQGRGHERFGRQLDLALVGGRGSSVRQLVRGKDKAHGHGRSARQTGCQYDSPQPTSGVVADQDQGKENQGRGHEKYGRQSGLAVVGGHASSVRQSVSGNDEGHGRPGRQTGCHCDSPQPTSGVVADLDQETRQTTAEMCRPVVKKTNDSQGSGEA